MVQYHSVYYRQCKSYKFNIQLITSLIIRRLWIAPDLEPYEAWGLNTLKHILAIVALSNISLITVIYPATMIVMYGILTGMAFLKQKVL